jgi:GWxTD domain-containing protein
MTDEIVYRSYHSDRSDSTSIGISDPTLFDYRSSDLLFSRGFSGTYSFGRNIEGVFEVRVPAESRVKYELALRQRSRISDPFDTVSRELMKTTVTESAVEPGKELTIAREDTNLVFAVSNSSSAEHRIVKFNIPGSSFEPGNYEIVMTASTGAASRTVVSPLRLVWYGMPLSIDDPKYAVKPMIHILDDDQYKEISSGSVPEIAKKLWAYWKTQDPTPLTAYNERMAAFFQRVDYSFFNFATGRSSDGALTDRGKVYILFGPPSQVERRLLPGESPVEVWAYTNKVKQVFRFTDPSETGNYKLVAVQPL